MEEEASETELHDSEAKRYAGADPPSGAERHELEVRAPEVHLRPDAAVLEPLRELDEVPCLRFASVYQAFDSLEDFEAAITLLRAEHPATGLEPRART